jgi:hypothetical protein
LRTELRAVPSLTLCLLLLILALDVSVTGRQASTPGRQVGISLAPSVVTLVGQPGQAHRQTLRLTNHTTRELAFRLEAQDVITADGRRAFIAAGELGDSIAATAVFSPREIVIAPGAVGVADVTVTVPAGTAVRGVAAIFRGQTVVGSQNGVAMTASLGALITFKLSNDVRLEATVPEVSPQTATRNLSVNEWVSNTGSEPVVASGAAALLNDAGVLIGKVPLEPQRLMPGERVGFRADYPSLLAPGRYRAILSLEYDANERKVLTRTAEFAVSPAHDDDRGADRGVEPRR